MIVLVGFMGAGKTTVGRVLAARLGLPFRDSDQVAEAQQGVAVRDLFALRGEAAFRDLEHEIVAALLSGPEAVVALGGGAVGDPRTVAALRGHQVVHLHVTLDEALDRVGGDEGRPMLAVADLAGLHRARAEIYRGVAVTTVDAGAGDAGVVATAVLLALGR